MTRWQNAKLGDLTTVISSGATPLGGAENYSDDGPVLFIRSQNVLMNELDISRAAYVSEGVDRQLTRTRLTSGDVLLNITGASIGRVTTFLLDGVRANVNQHVCVIRPKTDLLFSVFLSRYLSTPKFQAHINRIQSGGTRQALNFSQISDFLIPLPPLEEQRRIAAILDQAAALRTKRRQALAKLDTLTQSLFLEMFGDPIVNPMGWRIEKLGTKLKKIRYGTGSPPEYAESGIPFVRATNVKGGTVVTKGLKFITEAAAAGISKCRLNQNDLIIVRSGVNAGDCALIPKAFEGAFAGYDLILNLDASAAHFYNYLLNSAYGKRILEPLTRRAAQPHLNADQVKDLALISPPEEVLTTFMTQLQGIESVRRQQEDAVAKWDDLFGSLQHRAFRGEL